jgi:hypothetical protein
VFPYQMCWGTLMVITISLSGPPPINGGATHWVGSGLKDVASAFIADGF